MNLDQIIRAVQEAVGVNADGKPGPETWQAIYNRICPDAQPPEPSGDKVDDRSERVIATLLPEVQPYARALIAKAAASGIVIKVLSGLRTYDEQNDLYAQGRTKPGSIVTNARGVTPTTTLELPSTLACSKEANTSTSRPSIKRSVFLERTWGLSGVGTGKLFKTNRIFSFDQNGRPI